MINSFRKLFASPPERILPAVAEGQRVYAVGDVHGRLDLLVSLAEAIETDNARRGPADVTVIMLGDLIDRGPDSAGVLKAVRIWAKHRKLRFITGNHEEMFLEALENPEVLRHFLRYGGKETLLSYPIDPLAYTEAEIEDVQALMLGSIPQDDIDFIRSFEDVIINGDYVFVHAGIHPGTPLDDQRVSQLRWIREPFLSHSGDHGFVVVHGHTINREAEVLQNRIGIDTGAYVSGRLTALGLEGTERWLLETRDDLGTITTAKRAA